MQKQKLNKIQSIHSSNIKANEELSLNSVSTNQIKNPQKIKLPNWLIIYKHLINYISLLLEIRELNIESLNKSYKIKGDSSVKVNLFINIRTFRIFLNYF